MTGKAEQLLDMTPNIRLAYQPEQSRSNITGVFRSTTTIRPVTRRQRP